MVVDDMRPPSLLIQPSYDSVTATFDSRQQAVGDVSFTYTCGVNLHEELQVQGDMLQRVSAQQRFILDELVKMRASRGLPPHSSLPDGRSGSPLPHDGMPFRATTCA